MDSSNTPALSRRQTLTGIGMTAAAALVTGTAVRADAAYTDFVSRCRAWWQQSAEVERLGWESPVVYPDEPEAPAILSAALPDYGDPACKIWDARSLEGVIERQTYLVVENWKDGPWNMMRTAYLPASAELLTAASEMLAIRREYDAAVEKWEAETVRMDDIFNTAVNALDDVALEIVLTPVSSATELLLKFEIASEAELFSDSGEAGYATREAIAADVAWIVEREAES